MASSDPNPVTPPPGPPQGKGKSPKNDLPGISVVPMVLIGLLLLILLFNGSWFSLGGDRERVPVSKFLDGLEAKSFNDKNVHKAMFDRGQLTFQDKEDPKDIKGWFPKSAERPKLSVVNLVSLDEDLPVLTSALRKAKIPYDTVKPEDQTGLLILMYFVPLVLIVVLAIVVMRRISGAGSAMSFGRSRGKFYAQEDIGITFDDVAGIDEAVEELREIVGFLRNPQKYQALGGRIPRGVLLVGPPGTGKTLLAKAVAGEAGVPFFSLSGSDFVEMFVGVGAARVRDMFGQAAAKSPSIIFIDELDALGKVRGSGMPGGHDERDQTLNALLVEMDGFSSEQSVIVMAATNRPETLDPALMRPGRFDRHVVVDRPDVKGREAILKVHVRKIKTSDDVDVKYLARLTPGFSGADLASLVNEAALLAARRDKSVASMQEFEEGVERVVAGLEKQTRIIPQDEKMRVAYHEIGHALVACSLPHTDPVHKISIIPRGLGALGYTLQRPEDDRYLITRVELRNRICVLLGGIITEEIVYEETSTGAQNDLERATDIARRMVMEFGMSTKLGRVNYRSSSRSPFLGNMNASGNDYVHSEETIREIDLEVRQIIDEACVTVRDLLVERRAVLEQLTKVLFEREVMDAVQLRTILDEYRTSPALFPGTQAQERHRHLSMPEIPIAPPALKPTSEG